MMTGQGAPFCMCKNQGKDPSLSFTDKTLTCRDCSESFTFTAGEQEFYSTKGLLNEPTRCPSCRSARKSRTSLDSMDSGYERYGNFVSYGGRTPRQMHPAQCADCGDMTEVPFKPRGDRPVYCSSCYSKQRAASEAPQQS